MIRNSVVLTLCIFLFPGLLFPQSPAVEPEEPDFFFLTGGPYTQQKNSPQVIWANQWLRLGSGITSRRHFSSVGRIEYGLTDYMEADFGFGAQSTRHSLLSGREVETELDGVMVGARYRILREGSSPLTLTVGPQLLIPPSSERRRETGYGYAVDITAAKDWGGPVFVTASSNWRRTPGIRATETGRSRTLSEVYSAVALGFRPLELQTQSESKHDIHLFLETAGGDEDTVEDGDFSRVFLLFLAPGLRYGFLSHADVLIELGVSFPIGLNRQTPDWGTLIQVQFEMPGLF